MRRFVTALLALTMTISMVVPTYAATADRNAKSSTDKGPMLTVFGDSLGAGCTNFDFVFDDVKSGAIDQEFRDFVKFKNGKKNFNCDAVKMSYTSKLYRKLGASKRSKNATFFSIRAKEMCRFLGLKPYSENDYDDTWYRVIDDLCSIGKMGNPVNVKVYNEAISQSDIIVVEYGMNDLGSMLLNHVELMEDAVALLIKDNADNYDKLLVLMDVAKDMKAIDAEVSRERISSNLEAKVSRLCRDLEKLRKYKREFRQLVKSAVDLLVDLEIQTKYYSRTLLNYIAENKKDDAVVVVCSRTNPLMGMKSGLAQAVKVLIDPLIWEKDLYLRNQAKKHGFKFVDISEVSLNPGEPFVWHADEHGQQIICDKIYAALNK